jgi:hypothetical protein
MPSTGSAEDMAAQARFVFRGTVQKLNAANIPEVRDTSNTAIVKVDETIQAPKSLSHYTGREITVKLADPGSVKMGDEVVFFTNAWLFGNVGVAVQSIGHHPAGPETFALHSTEGDPVTNLEDRDTRAHYYDSDMVVSGTIVSIRLPGGGPGLQTTREHDPDWREAVVSVDQVQKGDPTKKEIVVRFPASYDRMWHHAPKLQVGQRGYFLLHRGGAEGAAQPRTATGGGVPDYYTVLHPEDFELGDHPGRIQKILSQVPGPGIR